MSEIWKPVPGYDGMYEVSDQGQVRSWKNGKWGRREKPKKRKVRIDPSGRPVISLWKANGRHKFRVHQLVLLAFVGPCPGNMECCHNDGNPANNNLENLRYDTHSGNQADRIFHRTSNRGERQGNSKLTADQVRAIRKLYRVGDYLQKELGAQFGVARTTINSIVNEHNWKHLD